MDTVSLSYDLQRGSIAPQNRQEILLSPHDLGASEIGGLAVLGRGAGPIQSSGGGLEHAAAHAEFTGDGRTTHGLVPACARGRRHLPF